MLTSPVLIFCFRKKSIKQLSFGFLKHGFGSRSFRERRIFRKCMGDRENSAIKQKSLQLRIPLRKFAVFHSISEQFNQWFCQVFEKVMCFFIVVRENFVQILREKIAEDAANRPMDPAWQQLVDTTKIREELGFQPVYPALSNAVEAGAL